MLLVRADFLPVDRYVIRFNILLQGCPFDSVPPSLLQPIAFNCAFTGKMRYPLLATSEQRGDLSRSQIFLCHVAIISLISVEVNHVDERRSLARLQYSGDKSIPT
jgi:hypothetical protein